MRVFFLIYTLICLLLFGCTATKEHESPKIPDQTLKEPTTDPWVSVDSKTEQLIVHRKGKPDVVFGNIAFGVAGVKQKLRQGDDVTPQGKFSIAWIQKKSKFHRFIGFNYPRVEDARRGLESGIINMNTFFKIKRAHEEGVLPPQDTPLGGYIGIHGVGKGSLEIHRIANWTAGCIALENDQIDKLITLVYPGVQIEIK